MRHPPLAIPLLLVVPLLALTVALPTASAQEPLPEYVCATTPTVQQTYYRVCVIPGSDICPVFIYQRTQWLSYGYCFPPQADASTPASADAPLARCVPIVDQPDFGERVCVDVNNRACIAWLEHTTKLGTAEFCLVPQPPPL